MYKKLLGLVLLMTMCNVWSFDPDAHSSDSDSSWSDSDTTYSSGGERTSEIEKNVARLRAENAELQEENDRFDQKIVDMSEDEFQQLLADARSAQESPEDEQELSSEKKSELEERNELVNVLMRARQSSARKKLFNALRMNNVKEVKDLLSEHPDAVLWREDGDIVSEDTTPLIVVASQRLSGPRVDPFTENKDEEEIAKLLIENGADLNAKGVTLGWTPLMHAIQAGKPKIVELLLKAGANKHIKTEPRRIKTKSGHIIEPGSTAADFALGRKRNAEEFGPSEQAQKYKELAEYIKTYDPNMTKSASKGVGK
jgi:hypothetical protein